MRQVNGAGVVKVEGVGQLLGESSVSLAGCPPSLSGEDIADEMGRRSCTC